MANKKKYGTTSGYVQEIAARQLSLSDLEKLGVARGKIDLPQKGKNGLRRAGSIERKN